MNITLSPIPRTRQELANLLGLSTKTLSRRIKTSGMKLTARKILTPDEQDKVLKLFGRYVHWESANA